MSAGKERYTYVLRSLASMPFLDRLELAAVSDVPDRTTYDAVADLERRGLVDSNVRAQSREGIAEFVCGVINEVPLLLKCVLQSAEHRVERDGQVLNLIVGSWYRNAGGQCARADAAYELAQFIHGPKRPTSQPVGTETSKQEDYYHECNHGYSPESPQNRSDYLLT